jgi:hypothetical protein
MKKSGEGLSQQVQVRFAHETRSFIYGGTGVGCPESGSYGEGSPVHTFNFSAVNFLGGQQGLSVVE